MGITIGKDIGAYDEVEPVDPDSPPEAYREEGTVASEVERSDFAGTLDTSDVAGGEHTDLRNVSPAFDAADANLARRLAESQSGDDRTPEEREAQRTPEDPLFVENQGERTDAEIVEALESGQVADPSGGANPAEGEPGEGQEENDQKTEEAKQQEAATGSDEDSTKASPEDVVKGNVPDVEAHLKEYPEDSVEVWAAEQALAKEEDRDPRAGVEAAVEKYRPYNPSEHNVGETKEYFATVDDAEVERVKAIEKDGQDRPGIMNWTRGS